MLMEAVVLGSVWSLGFRIAVWIIGAVAVIAIIVALLAMAFIMGRV